MNNLLFQETQRFTQWWLYLIVIATIVITLVGLVPVIFTLDDVILQVVITFSILLFIALMSSIVFMRLETRITQESIYMRFYPFVTREWAWNDIITARVIDYGFVGGWGIRLWTGYGTVYNIKGSKGIHFKTKDKEYIIGTQQPSQLEAACHGLLK